MKCVVVLLLSIGHSLTENQVHRLTDSVVHRRTDSVEYSLTNSLEDSPFCHVMETSGNTRFQSVPEVTPPVGVAKLMDSGQPFVVRGEAREWPAARLWSHAYFQQLFRDQSLFSSTFSTSLSPQFGTDYPNKAVYYGIFLNNQTLASEVAKDYEYPDFIPAPLRLQGGLLLPAPLRLSEPNPLTVFAQLHLSYWYCCPGNEWIHWGYPPCGAKRHVDLTCTSRVSVQLTGSKRWRLYPPPLSPLATAAPWSQVCVAVLCIII